SPRSASWTSTRSWCSAKEPSPSMRACASRPPRQEAEVVDAALSLSLEHAPGMAPDRIGRYGVFPSHRPPPHATDEPGITMRPRTALRATPLALCLLLAVTTAAFAHTALRSSSPEKDERLTVAPTEIRLRFTSAVDARLARVALTSADSSPVRLDSLRSGDAADEIVAPILDPLTSGEFTVSWQVIGTDGHPVRGTFAFVVDLPVDTTTVAPATDPEVRPPDPETQPHEAEAEPESAVQSPGNVAVRWLTFATILAIVGAGVFRTFVLESMRSSSTVP